MNEYTATYDPSDNKLRLRAAMRLDAELYARVKAAGFSWAPRQELFVAPMWTPEREDMLLELCGEIGDEDTSLVDRSEERADRFKDYSQARAEDADAAHAAVASICDGIPLGQPILVGHHSEKHARRDAERIDNGMRKAVAMWETSQYWKRRAAGAIHAAKYKERPDVRARRIKKIEADKRAIERAKAEAESALRFWRGQWTITNKETGEKKPLEISEDNRERITKLLGCHSELGYLKLPRKEGDKPDWEQSCGAWDGLTGNHPTLYALRTVEECRQAAEVAYPASIARKDRWIAHYDNRLAYERAMLEADGGTVTDKQGPEKGGGCKCWASHRGAWSYIQKVNKVSVTVLDNWGNGGGNFTRTIPFDKLHAVISKAELDAAKADGRLKDLADGTGFALFIPSDQPEAPKAVPVPDVDAEKFKALKEQANAGVQVVTAPQLFPTPSHIAKRMVELADIETGNRVLEPSAGTGSIMQAVGFARVDCEGVAVELSQVLANKMSGQFMTWDVRQADFLACNGDLGKFDRIVMNPPFERGADITHIKHALTFLNAGGRLVALCANGPRQQEQLQPLCDSWEELPEGSFSEQGTNINVALLVITN